MSAATGTPRIGGQIDLFAKSTEVRKGADICRDLNKGYKKKANQRQLEKAAKAMRSGKVKGKLFSLSFK